MNIESLAIAFLVMVAVGGVAWVFLYPLLSGERKIEQRRESVTRSQTVARLNGGRPQQKSRRDQVEETLKELELRNRKSKRPPLHIRIEQAGLDWSKQRFLAICAGLGFFGFFIGLGLGGNLLVALALAFAASIGLPLWTLSYLKRRRETKFLDGFPDAVEVIVRGIRSGLPLIDSLKVIASDTPEPIRSEFRAIVETQTVGLPLGEACGKLYERMPLAEANFFGIVIAIQQKSGGNLSETLSNLSKVLRDRKKMKAKIQAMSMEAKASASIIGALPAIVGLLVYLTSPNYIELLWTHEMGRMMLFVCAVWMTIGVLVMKKMINFDF